MAVLTTERRNAVARTFAETAFRTNVAHSSFPEILEAVAALDDWVEPRATDFVSALPARFVAKASVAELQALFLVIVRERLS